MTNTAIVENNVALQPLLGDLINFISEIAIAIRMNSSYSRNPDKPELMLENVMWLSDALHNLWGLGDAINSGDLESVSKAASSQADYWTQYQDNIVKSSGGHFDIAKGICLLMNIAETAALPSVDVV